mmetsp:Transcript_6388/g.11996  ORF Transcript_6388/g.11996 Transcript_6388/m.11996 type:complete len:520 (+) Transcript_6388:206-1765(+)
MTFPLKSTPPHAQLPMLQQKRCTTPNHRSSPALQNHARTCSCRPSQFKAAYRGNNHAIIHCSSSIPGTSRAHPQLADVLTKFSCKALLKNGTAELDQFVEELVASGGMSAEEHSLHVFDLGSVLRRFRAWKSLLPRVEPFYAVKCCGDPGLLAMLSALGASFDCASPAEMETVMAMGVGTERIIYANPCKLPGHIRHAASRGVQMTTFDNMCELEKMAALYPQAQLVLRVRADDPNPQCPLGNKYGAEAYEVEDLLRRAHELHLNVVGVSFHVGSGAGDPASFRRAIEHARKVFDCSETLGMRMSLLDIGGGFSGCDPGGAKLRGMAAHINSALADFFPEQEGVRVIAEPGRYFAAAASTLYCSIFSKRVRPTVFGSCDGGVRREDSHAYWIGDGVYGSFNSMMYDHAVVTARAAIPAQQEPCFPSTVFGPTCDGLDTVMHSALLPDMRVGDWLAFPNMGAYTTAAGSDFNGFDSKAIRTRYIVTLRDCESVFDDDVYAGQDSDDSLSDDEILISALAA